MSRASFFAYRSGKSEITDKAWAKLSRAERQSGVSLPLWQQWAAGDDEERAELVRSASPVEMLSMLPVEARLRFLDMLLERSELQMQALFLDAQELADVAIRKVPRRSDLKFFANKVTGALGPCREMWQSLIFELRASFGLDTSSLADRVGTQVKKKLASTKSQAILASTETMKQAALWNDLRLRLRAVTSRYGARAQLARKVGVRRQAVDQWLSGRSAPTAETTLHLLEWVTLEEAKQKSSAASASTQAALKTRKSKSTSYEKAKSNRRKT